MKSIGAGEDFFLLFYLGTRTCAHIVILTVYYVWFLLQSSSKDVLLPGAFVESASRLLEIFLGTMLKT